MTKQAELTVVALSGGVDSATAAGLLVEAGARVVGISMRLYDASGTSASVGGRCCGPRDLEDARRVAAHLGIPFYVANYQDDFRARVIDDFIAEYTAGRTPNPCVRCNQHIKFTPLLKRARALGATSLATGHYARIVDAGGRPRLARARDEHKDQSYFLFNMPEEALGEVRFPLGDLTKDQVRAHARRMALPVADKAESQEICFVPDGDYASFVAAHAPASPAPGEIVDEDGRVLGGHDGVHKFTIGQRRGLRVAAPEPRYVIAVDALTRRVTVGGAAALERRSIELEDVRWPSGAPSGPVRAAVQIRYRHAARPALVAALDGGRARVTFDDVERAPAPGQAAVFYDGETVLGGGFIAAA
ncbi:MAG TPA: tRNA 2-thiouridine(34) synthase MnmA [Polyangia bacterium]|nr:tRNA 2-thiouridine(34) synthase MnmA [Polyangia bacterium]